MRDDPELTHAVVHSLNEWLYEKWSFNYEDRIFTTPVITLPIVEKAIEELEWASRTGRQDRPHPPGAGARLRRLAVVRLRGVRPVLAGRGRRRRARLDARLRQRLLPLPGRLDRPAGDAAVPARPVPHADDGQAADRGHDGRARLPRRPHPLPDLRIAAVENGGDWVVPFLHHLADVYRKMPHSFDEDPVEAFKRNVWISPFHEDDIGELIDGHRRRPRAVRVRLPAPRGPGRAVQLRRPPARRPARRPTSPRSWAATSAGIMRVPSLVS